MKSIPFLLLALFNVAGCEKGKAPANGTQAGQTARSTPVADVQPTGSLVDARKGFQSKLIPSKAPREPVDEPPAKVFRKLKYDAPPGKLAAYLTPDPKDGKKHPAIIWITGGDCNSIGECWEPKPPADDQSAAAFRKAGIVLMFPSLRGGNDNPGTKEGFLGEVDDVLASLDFLEKQEYVDPKRIYLGGHSTGGTLVLLVSECTDRFRAVFSFGHADDVSGYPPEFVPFDTADPKEVAIRSPGRWLASIKSPTFVIEGANQGNIQSLQAMKKASTNANVSFLAVRRATHFSVLAPATKILAGKILADDGATCNIALTEAELNGTKSK